MAVSAIRHQHHVRLVDALPAGNRRAVEHLAVLEGRFVDARGRKRDVLLDATNVGEAEIDVGDVLFLDQFENLVCRHGKPRFLGVGNAIFATAMPDLLRCKNAVYSVCYAWMTSAMAGRPHLIWCVSFERLHLFGAIGSIRPGRSGQAVEAASVERPRAARFRILHWRFRHFIRRFGELSAPFLARRNP